MTGNSAFGKRPASSRGASSPSSDGPSNTPAIISPTTGGCPARPTAMLTSLQAMRMMAAARKNRVVRSAADMALLSALPGRAPSGGEVFGMLGEVGTAQRQPPGVPHHDGAQHELREAARNVFPPVAELHQGQPPGRGAGRADGDQQDRGPVRERPRV